MTQTTEAAKLEPGIYPGIAPREYRDWDAVAYSDLGPPLRLARAQWLPGEAVHCLVLEGDAVYTKRFHVIEDIALNTREGKAALAAAEAETGKVVIREKEERNAILIYREFAKTELGQRVIGLARAKPERAELSVVARLEGFAPPVKIRVDLAGSKYLVDIKTTGLMSKDQFVEAFIKYGYWARAAFYRDAWLAATGEDLPVRLIVIPKDAPSEPFELEVENERTYEYGRYHYRKLMELYALRTKEATE